MEVSYINQVDSIFFRNVMIYFDTKIKNLILEKIYNAYPVAKLRKDYTGEYGNIAIPGMIKYLKEFGSHITDLEAMLLGGAVYHLYANQAIVYKVQRVRKEDWYPYS